MLVLRTLLRGRANGYEIAKTIERLSDEVLQVDHGSLYPALRRLEKQALIAAKWEVSPTNRRARYYTLTAAGRKQIVLEEAQWKKLVRAIARAMRPAAKGM